jgi:hypothetical protein
MREENINGHTYQIGNLDAKRQFHVVRRLAPVLAAGGAAARAWLQRADAGASGGDVASLDGLFAAFGPLAEALGGMTDEATDYVINTCLAACRRQNGGTWALVATQGGAIMFSDLTMAEMLRLTLLVLQENLSGFLGEIGGAMNAEPQPAA